jgi:hypothetical protein
MEPMGKGFARLNGLLGLGAGGYVQGCSAP